MPLPKYIFSRYRYLLSQQGDPLIKIRIKLLLVCLLAFTGLFIVLGTLYAFQEHNFMLVRALLFIVLFSADLLLLLFLVPWKITGHIFISCLVLLIWSNIMFFVTGVNVVTMQYCILVLAGAYYILGAKWGLIYSVVGVLPVIGEILLENYTNYENVFYQLAVNNHAYVFTACFNFVVLLFIHNFFFRALNKANGKEKQLRTNLQRALSEAEEMGEAKTNFLTTMSHQLRTPLNAVVGMSNILLMEDPKPSQKSNLDILQFSADNLMATVNDILDFNQINNENVNLESRAFEPAQLIANVVGAFQPAAREKHLALICKCDAKLTGMSVLGDPVRLTQILFHLVGNAIKFTAKGFVQLDVKVTAREAQAVSIHFSVADSGIGVPEELKSTIFEPFTASLARTSRQFHSTLGLTIAYRLLKLHNSHLTFDSKEGVGTKFDFDLSYPLSAVGTFDEMPKAISAIGGMRVLVVEDEKLNTLVIKKILAQWDIIPDTVADGQEAVNSVINNDYDVILMDINMPVMDGFEASKQIRQLPLPGKATIPIIAVTASIGAAMEQIDQYPYIDDCLLKPFKPEDLREKLMEIAGRKVLNTKM
jgi:signal transduction histidine kinase/ActR/RegA family two-component response regulator